MVLARVRGDKGRRRRHRWSPRRQRAASGSHSLHACAARRCSTDHPLSSHAARLCPNQPVCASPTFTQGATPAARRLQQSEPQCLRASAHPAGQAQPAGEPRRQPRSAQAPAGAVALLGWFTFFLSPGAKVDIVIARFSISGIAPSWASLEQRQALHLVTGALDTPPGGAS